MYTMRSEVVKNTGNPMLLVLGKLQFLYNTIIFVVSYRVCAGMHFVQFDVIIFPPFI